MSTLCLSMIIKNESHIIEDTLNNICQNVNIDYWLISDTGSTDNTVEIIESFFKNKNIRGEVKYEKWVDFAHNRNKALEACWGKSDYILIFDADDLFEGNFILPKLTKDGYYLKMREDEVDVVYSRRLIIKNNKKYHWQGVLHEVLEPNCVVNEEFIKGSYCVVSRRLGSRNNDQNKALNDALILEKEFEKNTTDENLKARYAYYCARSYLAYATYSGLDKYLHEAIKWFNIRLNYSIKNEVDQRYVVYESLGILYEKIKEYDKAVNAWIEGTRLDLDRAECWYDLARYYNSINNLDLAYSYAMQGIQLTPPEETKSFVNTAVYNYGLAYELCIICWKKRDLEKSFLYFKKALVNLPKVYLKDFGYIAKSYKKFIEQDTPKNVESLKLNLTKLDCIDILNFEKTPKICLNMIVKNESSVILRTLNCLCQYFDIDYWVISDTGSTDNTIQIIKDFFYAKKIPGEIHENEWKNFEYNRNKALDLCANKGDYILFFDADDLIEGDLYLPKLTSDAYILKFKEENDDLIYSRMLIVKNNGKFRWKGVLHEVLVEEESINHNDTRIGFIEGNYYVISRHVGARNQNPNKLFDDIKVLESSFLVENDYKFKSRYAFYCAKCYLSLALKQKKYINKAIYWFEERLKFTHEEVLIDDEIYCSFLYLGILYKMKNDTKKAIFYWIEGTVLDGSRAECWQSLANLYYLKAEYEMAYNYAKKCVDLPLPLASKILVNKALYDYYCLLEMCLITSKLNKFFESYSYFKRLLPKLPPEFLRSLTNVIPKYSSYLKNEKQDVLIEMKSHFKRLGRENYLDGLLR